MGAWVSAELLLDNSAWARLDSPALAQARVDELAAALENQRLATSLPFLLEVGYSARTAQDHDELIAELLALPYLPIDGDVEARAVDAQGQLARAGHHRMPPVDLIQAALADRHGVGILHYDRDYDVVATKTDLRFDSVWLAPACSV
jgi:predicted nucleic acid-binding protein